MAIASIDTRQRIVLAGAELFRKQGYSATTIAQVAEATGLSKGNLTYHYANKQALYREVHDLAIRLVREREQRSFAEAPDTVTAIEEFCRRLRRLLIDEEGRFVGCLFTNVAIETQHSDTAIAEYARSALSEFKSRMTVRLAEGQARGQVRDDLDAHALARQYFWMYEGALVLARAQDDPAEYDAFRAGLRRWLAH